MMNRTTAVDPRLLPGDGSADEVWYAPDQSDADSTIENFSPVDVDRPDLARYPRFRYARPIVATLEEGDVLFMPGYTWHNVYSWGDEETRLNVALNVWYEGDYQYQVLAQAMMSIIRHGNTGMDGDTGKAQEDLRHLSRGSSTRAKAITDALWTAEEQGFEKGAMGVDFAQDLHAYSTAGNNREFGVEDREQGSYDDQEEEEGQEKGDYGDEGYGEEEGYPEEEGDDYGGRRGHSGR
jgi:hypothetical protein